MKLNPELKDFWKENAQIKVLYGGRLSSKTMDTAGVLAYLASTYKIRVACLRRFQNKISESVYSTLKRTIQEDERLKDKFTITENSIKSVTGSEFIFMGIQRNLEEIKGLDNITITWIEEAENITKEQWDLIRPTILREENSTCLLVFNPRYATDYIYKEFVIKNHNNVLKRKINYEDNPFLSDSAKSLIIEDKKTMEEEDFEHVYHGEPKQNDDDAIIKRKWINASIDFHLKHFSEPLGRKYLGFDVADSGDDKNATILRHAHIVTDIEEWQGKEDELQLSFTKVFNKAREEDAIINYDSIGVGAGAGSKFKELNNSSQAKMIQYNKFNAGAKILNPDDEYKINITNKEAFSNLKAQMWQIVADRFRNTYEMSQGIKDYEADEVISIDSSVRFLDTLITELSTPRKDYNANGQLKVESKKDLAKRGINSPNIADSFIMSFYQGEGNSLYDAMMADY